MIDRPITVLLVEDNTTDAALIKRQISKLVNNANILVESELRAITELITKTPPDIVLCDYNLPKCDGLDVLELCQDKIPDVIFVFVTGTIDNEELAAETILNGASGYILKKNINILHERLAPYFAAIENNRPIIHPIRKQIAESKRIIGDVEQFLKNFDKDSLMHKEGIERIKSDIERIKKNYNVRSIKGRDENAS